MFVYLLKRLPCAGGNPVSAGINFKDKDKDNDKDKEGLPLKKFFKSFKSFGSLQKTANLNILTLSEDEKVSLEALRFEPKRNNKRDFKVHWTNNQSRDGGWTMHRALNLCLLSQILTLCKNERDSQRNQDINFSSFCHFAKKSS